MSNGGFIGLTNKQSDGKIDGIGGTNTSPIGETSIFYNESMDGIPRQEDLFAVRVLGQTSQIEWIKDKAKSQIASTEFSVVPDVPKNEDREPSDREIEAAERLEQFFRGEFNDNNTSEDALHGQLLDDIFDINSGVIELVPDNEGFVKKMLVHDGLTFTINENEHGELPDPDADEPAYYQFSLASHAKQFFRSDKQGIDVRELRDKMHQLPFTKLFDREQKEFSRDRIVWFSEPQNEKTYTPYGRGRTQKVKDYAEVMINGDMHRNRFFLDNEFHKGVLAVDNNTSQKDKESLRKRFKNSAGNEHELPVVGGAENMEYVSIDPDPEAMQFLESQKWYTRSVLRAYGLNDVAGGVLEDANKGISDNAKQQIFRQVTGPILNMFEKKWNNEVLPFMREYQAVDGNVKFVYEPENRFLQRIENDIIDQELNNGTITINEAREKKGKEPFGPVGDLPKAAFEKLANSVPDYVAENLNEDLENVPSGGSGAGNPFELTVNNNEGEDKQPQTININNGKDDDGQKETTADSSKEDEKKEGESGNPSDVDNYRDAFNHKDELLEQTKDALRNERGFNDVPGIVEHKEEMKSDIAEVFESINLEQQLRNEFPDESQENGVLVDADGIVENLDFKDRLGSVIESNNLGALEMSAEHHEQEIESETEERLTIPEESKVEISFDIMDTFTADIIRQEAFSAATEIESSVKDRLKNQILKGAEKGEGIDQITNRIQNVKGDISRDHAELVARTETLQSSRKGSQALAESTDLVEGKEWLATSDSRVREWHGVMDGEVVPKDDHFVVPQVNSDKQPNDYPRNARVVGEDQVFRCRCSQAPVLAEDMPDSPQQLEADFNSVNVDLGVTQRQYEVWKEHGQDFDSFEKFWGTKTEEMSKSEIAESFEMSKTTVYSWSE